MYKRQLYGSKVFNEHEMRERLPSSTYKSLKATIENGQPLDLEVANVVASVMTVSYTHLDAGNTYREILRQIVYEATGRLRDLPQNFVEGESKGLRSRVPPAADAARRSRGSGRRTQAPPQGCLLYTSRCV